MDRARDQFLAGSRFSGDEHAGIGARDFFHDAEDRLDRIALADDVFEAILLAQFAAQKMIFLEQRLGFERVAHLIFQMIIREWLGDVVVGALLQRLHRGFDAGIGGDDDRHHLAVDIAHFFEHVESAAASAQVQIENREVDFLLLENLPCNLTRRCFDNFVAFAAHQIDDDRAHQRFIFDDENAVTAAGIRRKCGLF